MWGFFSQLFVHSTPRRKGVRDSGQGRGKRISKDMIWAGVCFSFVPGGALEHKLTAELVLP